MSEQQACQPIPEPRLVGDCENCGKPRYQFPDRAYRDPVRCSQPDCGTELCNQCAVECDFRGCSSGPLCNQHSTGIDGEVYCPIHVGRVFGEIVAKDREAYRQRFRDAWQMPPITEHVSGPKPFGTWPGGEAA